MVRVSDSETSARWVLRTNDCISGVTKATFNEIADLNGLKCS
jgi:hypothetical protein